MRSASASGGRMDRDTRCHHSLARTRRSHKQQIVHSGYRNLTRPLHQPLSVYLRKIGKHCGLCFFYIIFLCGVLLPRRILKKTHDLPDIFHTADKHPGNKRRLFSIARGTMQRRIPRSFASATIGSTP